MKKILITGATGNVGFEVIRFLEKNETPNTIIAGVRNIESAKKLFKDFPKIELVNFDFEQPETFDNALKGIDTIFLLRPPHIADVETYFRPLILKIKEHNVNEVVFLSVQGAEKSKVIPHNKIERLIQEYKLSYIFLRPSYFMQNLTTTLLDDIKTKRQIILPSGKAKFNWIDIENIGETCSVLLNNFSDYRNLAIELTGNENLNFFKVADLLNATVKRPISFTSVSPFEFYRIKKKEGMVKGLIVVMIMLHFLPRFQKEPAISGYYEKIIGKKPTSLSEFIEREKIKFE
ncbi:MAG: NmrA family NAD(P)-binding protein [Paludibacter sp.]|nr:NmrA family NAD(P)-binding protein [Paludibacter sp.]